MKMVKRIVSYFTLISFLVLICVICPKITGYVNNVIDNFSVVKVSISDKIKNTNYEPIKNIDHLIKKKENKIINTNDSNNSNNNEFSGTEYDFDTKYYPYYGIIDRKYHTLYKQIYSNAINLNSTFTPIVEVYKDEVTDIIEAVMFDHPELFWLDNKYSYKYDNSGKCFQIILKFNSIVNDNFEERKKEFIQAADTIINIASSYSSDYEKEIFVHDKLVESLKYDNNAVLNQSAYSALVNHLSVCAGYSKAFQYIMTKLGIPCYYVTGYSLGDHAWNIVNLDGYYYNVDLTWDNTGSNKYSYFNKNDNDFSITHTRNEMSSKLPSCIGTSYNIRENTSTNLINTSITAKDYLYTNEKEQSNTNSSIFVGEFEMFDDQIIDYVLLKEFESKDD